MVEKEKKIWLEGELVDWDEAKVHVLAHTLHYGLGAFEGIRAYRRENGKTAIFRLREHVQRLYDTCKLIAVNPRFTFEQVCKASVDVVRANKLSEAYVRPLVFIGPGAMGVYAPDNPILTTVMAWRWGAYLGAGALEKGVRTKISAWIRHHPSIALAKGKIMGQYTNSVLAKREARIAGYDEAILMDIQGNICEGSGENLFIVKKGKLITPPLNASILAGITRDTVITLAREESLVVEERHITRDQLYLADEAFFTGTAVEVTPVREVDDRAVGDGAVGPITRRLQERYFDVVKGKDETHPEWLTYV
ncbi:MAG TPA: branched-chain amino acid transaminase [Polyangiaceae bacterium]|jgi:branched-chain amino acid aminotransferase|nr:branched-chain amino acid transaminase [Polyangiaceae bacterium]